MAQVHVYVQRHCPLITPRIEFQLSPRPALPRLTPRTEFNEQQLIRPPAGSENDIMTSRQPRRVSFAVADRDPTQEQDESRSLSPPIIAGSSSAGPSTPIQTKIPKPNGEPGRPGSGGYCLDSTLLNTYNWSQERLDRLASDVRKEAKKKLDMTKSYRYQNAARMKEICEKMMEPDLYPELQGYDNCWPVRSFLKLALKYKSEATRRVTVKKTNNRLRSALLRASTPESEDS
ncbi:hypothetical protein BDZ97DRAFT_1919816 [Flammula alnicola]|nr:hypothetical protein BDZ97DRAFT_1919816 [Flammula alnicola]